MKIYRIALLIPFILLLNLMSCPEECEPSLKAVGAKCNDGTITTATDSGACSDYGGLDYWLIEDNCDEYTRVGAMCNDGTISTATGSGACSWHGGVDYWLRKGD